MLCRKYCLFILFSTLIVSQILAQSSDELPISIDRHSERVLVVKSGKVYFDQIIAIASNKGLVVIDEVQRLPELFPVIRVLVDRPKMPARFLILGSASPGLLQQSSETLAGRIIYHRLNGFMLDEVGIENHKNLWLRGGFPLSYLARNHSASHEWRQGFIQTFLERDNIYFLRPKP